MKLLLLLILVLIILRAFVPVEVYLIYICQLIHIATQVLYGEMCIVSLVSHR